MGANPSLQLSTVLQCTHGRNTQGTGTERNILSGEKQKEAKIFSPLLQVVRDKRLVTLTPLESMGGGNIFLSARKKGRRWRSKTLQMPTGKTVSAKKKVSAVCRLFLPLLRSPMSSSPIFAEEKMGGKKNVAALLSRQEVGEETATAEFSSSIPLPSPVFTHGY